MKYNENNPIDFQSFKWETFISKMKVAIKECEQNILLIKQSPASFENTIIGLETCDIEVDQLHSIFSMLTAVNKDPDMADYIDKIDIELNEMISKLENDIFFDKEIFQKVHEVYQDKDNYKGEDFKLLTKLYKGFVNNGIHLSEELQNRLREIDEEIGSISIKIGSNLQKEPSLYFINVSESEVSGIPQDYLDVAKETALERGESGYTFGLDDSSFYTVSEFADSQSLRIKITDLYRSIGNNDNEFDNKELIKKLMLIKTEKAQMLGFKDYSELMLQDKMVKNIETVNSFLNELDQKIRPVAKEETYQLTKLAQKDNIKLTRADEWYYESKLKSKLCNIDLNELRNYFEYSHVLQGMFTFINNLYGITFNKVAIPVYSEGVDSYIVKENNIVLGIIYFDPFTNDFKQGGAWMTPIISRSKDQIPFISISCNFTPKNDKQQSLLSLSDVKTLFHETGHALHDLFSKVNYSSLSGSNVALDFAELPSQIMENFVYEKKVLDLIAKHIITGELIPEEMVLNLQKMDKLFNATNVLGNVGLARLDLNLHSQNTKELNFEEVNSEFTNCKLTDQDNPKCNRTTNFDHILCSGYDVGYYSYQWSKVLDSTCFELFKANNYSNEIAKEFRQKILEVGSSRDEMESFIDFTGKQPNIDAFLKLMGIS